MLQIQPSRENAGFFTVTCRNRRAGSVKEILEQELGCEVLTVFHGNDHVIMEVLPPQGLTIQKMVQRLEQELGSRHDQYGDTYLVADAELVEQA